MKKRAFSSLLLAGVLATFSAGVTTATKSGDCPPAFQAGIVLTDANGELVVPLESIGGRDLKPEAAYCTGQHPQDPALFIIGPRIFLDL